MSPSKREKEAARRRHEKWVERQLQQESAHKRRRTIGLAVLAVIVVAALVWGIWAIVAANSDDTPTVTPQPETSESTAAAQSEPSASPSFAAAPNKIPGNPKTVTVAATAEGDPCPVPTGVVDGPNMTFDAAPDAALSENRTWTGTMKTSCGDLGLTLDGAKAPIATASFVMLAKAGYFDNTLCHRLTTSGLFVLQCGDPTGATDKAGSGGPGYSFGPIENPPATAADGSTVYPVGTLAMANASDPFSNGSQFFIVYKDTTLSPDYTVLGQITSGMDIVNKIAAGGTAPASAGTSGGIAPAWPIAIEGVSVK